TIRFWDIYNRAVVRSIPGLDPIASLAVSPDGRLLAVQTSVASIAGAGDSERQSRSRVEVRDFDSGRVLYEHEVGSDTGQTTCTPVCGLEFSPDGRELAVLGCCSEGSAIEVWDARSGADLFRPSVHGIPSSIAFSPDGRRMAVGLKTGGVAMF